MKKVEIRCDQPGCDYRRMVNPNYVKQTIGRHNLFTHGIRGTSDAAKDRYRKKEKLKAAEQTGPRDSEVEQPERRKYTKRPKPGMQVTLCPVCGCNIQAVNVAINLGR